MRKTFAETSLNLQHSNEGTGGRERIPNDNERRVMQKFLKTSDLNAHYFFDTKRDLIAYTQTCT